MPRHGRGDLDQVKRQWVERKERLSGERQEEEPQKRGWNVVTFMGFTRLTYEKWWFSGIDLWKMVSS